MRAQRLDRRAAAPVARDGHGEPLCRLGVRVRIRNGVLDVLAIRPSWIGRVDAANNGGLAGGTDEHKTARHSDRWIVLVTDLEKVRMTPSRQPRLATWLLLRLASGDKRDSLIGDLFEQYDPSAETFVFSAQKTTYGGRHIAKGDTIPRILLARPISA